MFVLLDFPPIFVVPVILMKNKAQCTTWIENTERTKILCFLIFLCFNVIYLSYPELVRFLPNVAF